MNKGSAQTIEAGAGHPESHGAHSHHHDHGHKHEHREIPKSEEYDLDSLFGEHINKNDMNVKIVLFLCRITRAHLFVKLFDDLMKPLPSTA